MHYFRAGGCCAKSVQTGAGRDARTDGERTAISTRLREMTAAHPWMTVPGRTWSFPGFLHCSTLTHLGSQCLYRQLRRFPADAQQSENFLRSGEMLGGDPALRERIQMTLATLDADSGAMVIDYLLDPPVERLSYPRLTLVWSILCVGLLSGMALSLVPLGLAIPMFAVNVAVTARKARQRYDRTEALRLMHRMVGAARTLAALAPNQPIAQLQALAAEGRACERARRALRTMEFSNRLPLGLGSWLNFLCLADWVAYRFTAQRLPVLSADLLRIYDLVGSLDAAIALASFLEHTPTWCRPGASADGEIEIDGGYHPLLPSPILNSLYVHDRSALISGSNMGGKTTFIKMIGINVILGRNLGICLATRARIPHVPVMACIRTQQSVESGKSRYFDEIEAILSFLRSGPQAPLLVLDEPFSGTNTTERIAAAKAVLRALSVHSGVLATTHDVELQALLADRFDLYHFQERPDLDALFDYVLRPGPCTEGNALRLLARVGFPPEIVEEAMAFVEGRGGSRAERLECASAAHAGCAAVQRDETVSLAGEA